VAELEQQKNRLSTYQVQARFALATMYDRAANPEPDKKDQAAPLQPGNDTPAPQQPPGNDTPAPQPPPGSDTPAPQQQPSGDTPAPQPQSGGDTPPLAQAFACSSSVLGDSRESPVRACPHPPGPKP
jgi:hypothetical protein